MSAREAILGRVRAAIESRGEVEHPGAFQSGFSIQDAIETFEHRFRAAGGEVVHVSSRAEAASWLRNFAADYSAVTVGRTVPDEWATDRPRAEPAEAGLAISIAVAAVAETGSLVLDARDGRRTQLLAPDHVVILRGESVVTEAHDALERLAGDLPSAIGLHSGPSKSADIGQVMVRGVHGPGRVVALVVGAPSRGDESGGGE